MLRGTVGVVVPNYNYARYLPERLASIASQGEVLGGLTFLDDASTDNSMAVAEPLLAEFACPVSVLRNPLNSGSVLRQWARGLAETRTPYLWIAEADDTAEPGMAEILAKRLAADPAAAFAFADSAAIGPEGEVIEESGKRYSAAMGDPVLERDAAFPAGEFLRRCLAPRNLVVSASAVLWRTEALRAAFARLREEVARWRFAGDWRVYVEAMREDARVHYVARPLSRHRRHGGSVTGAASAAAHYAEVVALHCLLRRLLPEEQATARMRRHLSDLRRAWALG
ncbi:glycosyltransferase [Roseomonas sp. SSH11]|uniref:Glycosyltransferase n=1 Tax=Pararoseomonas baculiformis TaxID=2820812 RepID=A0ABS4AJF9_9PROT|nr:glycosyltransferase family 2 protein [Pararoseomonas baculiformis]MBP0447011.1 glycosyltransferase [Pararoseomonas baculiformis]